MSEFDSATAAVEAALAAGARYADARVMYRRYESMSAQNGEVEELAQDENAGLGVRALVGSGWGFFAVPELADGAVRAAGERAAAIAAASASVSGPVADLVPVPVGAASWANECRVDPLEVPLSDKGDLLVGATARARAAGADLAEGLYQIWDTRKWFVSSEGHRIDQHIRECGAGISATVIGESETQRRSYPSYRGQYGTRGWGHAIELDRILGWEAAFAGTSWLDLARLGHLTYGSDLMNIVIDPTIPGALGSFGYDDEGTPASRRYAVHNGQWVGVLAGRDSAAVAGLDYGGSVRADGWARLPMVRMTNVGLEPGPHTLDEMISATDDGVYMDTNRSWSIDDKRLNFQFGCEIAYEIKDGRLGRMLRNPTYTGIGPLFWRSMDMLSNEVVPWGTPNCGKGQPGQIGHTGHPAAPARFTGVRVGVHG